MHRRVEVRGPVTPQTAWARYERFDAWPGWAPHLRRVEAAGAVIEPGVRGAVYGPAGVRVRFRIDTVDPVGRAWSWTVWLPGTRLVLRHDLAPDGAGCRAGVDLVGPALVVGPYAPFTRWPLHRLVRPGGG